MIYVKIFEKILSGGLEVSFSIGECLLISSLPGKALRTLVDIAKLAERFNKRSQSLAW